MGAGRVTMVFVLTSTVFRGCVGCRQANGQFGSSASADAVQRGGFGDGCFLGSADSHPLLAATGLVSLIVAGGVLSKSTKAGRGSTSCDNTGGYHRSARAGVKRGSGKLVELMYQLPVGARFGPSGLDPVDVYEHLPAEGPACIRLGNTVKAE